MCQVPVEILYTDEAETIERFKILKWAYLNNRLINFYGTTTKMYCDASSMTVCNIESGENNL